MRKKGETLTKTYNKVYLYIFVAIVFSMVVTQIFLIKPTLKNIQRREDVQNINKIRSVITSKLDFINGIVVDNSNWDVMSKAIEEKNIEFLESGYEEYFLESIGGNHLSLYNADLIELYKVSLEDIDSLHAVQVRKKVLENYDEKVPNLNGIVTLEKEHYYYSIGKITDESDDDHFGGVFFLIKKIDGPFVENISRELDDKIIIDHTNYEADTLEEINLKEGKKNIYYLRTFEGKNEYLLRYNYKSLAKDEFINLKIILENDNKEYIDIFNYRVKIMVVMFFIVILILNYLLKKQIVDPVANLSSKMNRFLTDQDDYLVNGEKKEDEISTLMNNYDTLIHMIDEREKKLKDILYVDSLTGVGTRRVLDEKLEELFVRVKGKEKLAVAMLDIDYFKRYNDNYGHQKGDEVLKTVGAILKESFDSEDYLVIRYGGEEFIIFGLSKTEEEFKNKVIKLREKLKSAKMTHEYSEIDEKIVSFSCGVINRVPKENENAKDFIREADEKLYKAKTDGRDRIVF